MKKGGRTILGCTRGILMFKKYIFQVPSKILGIVVSQNIRKMIFVKDVLTSQQLRNVRIAYQSYLIMNNNKKCRNKTRKLKLRYVMGRSERKLRRKYKD